MAARSRRRVARRSSDARRASAARETFRERPRAMSALVSGGRRGGGMTSWVSVRKGKGMGGTRADRVDAVGL